jgi:hypothetical protein
MPVLRRQLQFGTVVDPKLPSLTTGNTAKGLRFRLFAGFTQLFA